ncbi:LOW QUALITY PROTEIN: hypothetical protein MAR_027281 [Mya arenaria]|uniref:Uncharacterized protein n=1 Tax=Mya arenaria TaxID=6604 RepID=A0ABY7EWL6_MYAAR|nr:LOW QUALITY PROTEIN: hypothetical protein MAR_027281 [Mya arenaria]
MIVHQLRENTKREKYGIHTTSRNAVGIETSRRQKKDKSCLTNRIKVTAFYLRVDNSRILTGTKNTRTKGKKKKTKKSFAKYAKESLFKV